VRARLPLLLLAVVLAGSFAFHAHRAEHPTSSYQSSDERAYGKLALDLAEVGSYGSPGTKMREPLRWPPGAPVLFATAHELSPSERSLETADIPAAYWAQALVSVGSTLAAAGLAWALAGAWAAVLAAALVGFYPPLILSSGEQVSEPLGAFCVVSGFALLALAVRRRALWAYAIAGVGLGAAVLTRADLILMPFVVGGLIVVAGLVAARRGGRPGAGRPPVPARRALAAGVAVVGGALLLMAPWSLYVSDRSGGFVPVTSGSSSALFVGTYLPGKGTTVGMKRALGPEAKRRYPKLRGTPSFEIEARLILRVVADRHPELASTDAIAKEGRRNITRYGRADPVGFAGMMVNKVQRMWTRYARGGARPTSTAIRAWHIVLVAFSVAGLVAGTLRGRSLVLAAIGLTILYATAVHMIVVSQARYNLPLMPALLAGGVAGWALFLRARRAGPGPTPLSPAFDAAGAAGSIQVPARAHSGPRDPLS
jgi:hypothetical protein